MFLTISGLQSLTSFAFPSVLPQLHQAIVTANEVVYCQECPKRADTALQNVTLVNSLLSSIGERFQRLLESIEIEAAQAEQEGTTKEFRLGDVSIPPHEHTGTPDCPGNFSVQLEAQEWRRLAKKTVKAEVMGNGTGRTNLVGVLDAMEARQKRWHIDPEMDKMRISLMSGHPQGSHHMKDEELCLKFLGAVKLMISRMVWD